MKRMLETQIAGMAWRELQEHPQKLRALQTMINLGIEPRLAREIIAELPAGAAEDAERARFLPLGLLSRRIPVVSADPIHERSEEHTSELQSLMRISYAVFCLKKKKN